MYNDENDTIDNNQGLFVLGPGICPLQDLEVFNFLLWAQRKNITYRF